MMRLSKPVASSTSSRIVSPDRTSSKRTAPPYSVRMGVVYGSQRTMSSSLATGSPSPFASTPPWGIRCRSSSRPSGSTRESSPLRLRTSSSSGLVLTVFRLWNFTRPLCFVLIWDCSTTRCAVPPMWNVRMVSWVPGSPMDCAAMMPTASPSSAIHPVARFRP